MAVLRSLSPPWIDLIRYHLLLPFWEASGIDLDAAVWETHMPHWSCHMQIGLSTTQEQVTVL